MLAAVTGKSIYLEHLAITQGTTLGTITIGAGETAGAVTTVVAGPFNLVGRQHIDVRFSKPIKLAAATALTVDASASSASVNVIAEGFVQ